MKRQVVRTYAMISPWILLAIPFFPSTSKLFPSKPFERLQFRTLGFQFIPHLSRYNKGFVYIQPCIGCFLSLWQRIILFNSLNIR